MSSKSIIKKIVLVLILSIAVLGLSFSKVEAYEDGDVVTYGTAGTRSQNIHYGIPYDQVPGYLIFCIQNGVPINTLEGVYPRKTSKYLEIKDNDLSNARRLEEGEKIYLGKTVSGITYTDYSVGDEFVDLKTLFDDNYDNKMRIIRNAIMLHLKGSFSYTGDFQVYYKVEGEEVDLLKNQELAEVLGDTSLSNETKQNAIWKIIDQRGIDFNTSSSDDSAEIIDDNTDTTGTLTVDQIVRDTFMYSGIETSTAMKIAGQLSEEEVQEAETVEDKIKNLITLYETKRDEAEYDEFKEYYTRVINLLEETIKARGNNETSAERNIFNHLRFKASNISDIIRDKSDVSWAKYAINQLDRFLEKWVNADNKEYLKSLFERIISVGESYNFTNPKLTDVINKMKQLNNNLNNDTRNNRNEIINLYKYATEKDGGTGLFSWDYLKKSLAFNGVESIDQLENKIKNGENLTQTETLELLLYFSHMETKYLKYDYPANNPDYGDTNEIFERILSEQNVPENISKVEDIKKYLISKTYSSMNGNKDFNGIDISSREEYINIDNSISKVINYVEGATTEDAHLFNLVNDTKINNGDMEYIKSLNIVLNDYLSLWTKIYNTCNVVTEDSLQSVKSEYQSLLDSLQNGSAEKENLRGITDDIQGLIDGNSSFENIDQIKNFYKAKQLMAEANSLSNLNATQIQERNALVSQMANAVQNRNYSEIARLNNELQQWIENNIVIDNGIDVEAEIERTQQAVNKATAFQNFYNRFHADTITVDSKNVWNKEQGDGTIDGMQSSVDQTKVEVVAQTGTNNFIVGPYTLHYIADSNYPEFSHVKSLKIIDADTGNEIQGASIQYKNERVWNHEYPYPGEEFYVSFRNSEDAWNIRLEVEIEGIEKYTGTVQKLVGVKKQYAIYGEVTESSVASTYDDGEPKTYNVTVALYADSTGESSDKVQEHILVQNTANGGFATPVPFTISAKDVVHYEDEPDDETEVKIKVLKESSTGATLEGAKFDIAITNKTTGKTYYYDGVKTSSSGYIDEIVLGSNIVGPEDEYEVNIVETEAPEKHNISNKKTKLEFDLDENGNIVNNIQGGSGKVDNTTSTKILTTVVKDSRRGSSGGGPSGDNPSYDLEFIKVDGETKKTLQGARFEVKIDGKSYTVDTKNGGAGKITGLRLEGEHTVTIEEKVAPAGYSLPIDNNGNKIIYSFKYRAEKIGGYYKLTYTENSDNLSINDEDKNHIDVVIPDKKNYTTSLRMNLGGLVYKTLGSGKSTYSTDDGIYVIADRSFDSIDKDLETLTNALNVVYTVLDIRTADDFDYRDEEYVDLLDTFKNISGIDQKLIDTATDSNQKVSNAERNSALSDIKKKAQALKVEIQNRIDKLMDSCVDGLAIVADDVLVELYDSDNKLIDSTYAVGGYYTFYNLDPGKYYYTKFIYDGQKYEAIDREFPTYNSQDWVKTSKAIEDRVGYNNKFSTISAYPENYVVTDSIFGFTTNSVYLLDDVSLKELAEEVKDFKQQHHDVDIRSVYEIVGSSKEETDRSKLQFLYDVSIGAVTSYPKGTNGLETGYYPVYDNKYITLTRTTDTVAPSGNVVKAIYNGQYFINLGLEGRGELDLEVSTKLLEKIDVTVNGKNETYNYEKTAGLFDTVVDDDLIKYLEIRQSDVNYISSHNDENNKIELTYKIELHNNSAVPAVITKVVDFYDSDQYDISGITWMHNDSTGTATWEKQGESGLPGYTKNIISLPNEVLNDQETMTLYVTLHMKDMTDLKEALEYLDRDQRAQIESVLQLNNLVEIYEYTTNQNEERYRGLLDIDSIPGNLASQIYGGIVSDIDKTNWEDDAEQELMRYLYQEPRTFEGNVWEESRYTESNVTFDESKTKLANIKVDLVEQKENGRIYSTYTDANGAYKFEGYLPGSYETKFTYGYGTDSTTFAQEITDKHDGEQYQSVRANANTSSTYWYNENTNTRYSDAYDDYTSRKREIDYLETYRFEKGNLINNGDYTQDAEALQALTMEAYTAPLELEVEYAKTETVLITSKTTSEERTNLRKYEVKNIDFGITKRPESQMIVKKVVKDITITLSNGRVLIDHVKPTSIASQLVEYAKQLPGKDLYFEVDDEILTGAQLTVNYDVIVANVGRASTLTTYIDDEGNEVAIGYYGSDETMINRDAIRKGPSVDVTTAAKELVDYVQSGYIFKGESQQENGVWTTISENSRQRIKNEKASISLNIELNDNQTILTANSNITDDLKSGEYRRSTLTLTKQLAVSEDLNFDNIIEITEMKNTAGRVAHGDNQLDLTLGIDENGNHYVDMEDIQDNGDGVYKETPGDLDPTRALTDNRYRELQLDEAKAEMVAITDPTGADYSNTGILIAVIVIAGIAAGIVLIKKYVVKPVEKDTDSKE